MQLDEFLPWLADPQLATPWLQTWGVTDVARAHANLQAMARAGITPDLLHVIGEQLAAALPEVSDPDMALNNLERFASAARNPLSFGALLEREPDALPILLTMFSASQHLSDVLVRDPEAYDLLRLTEGQPLAREALIAEICGECGSLTDERAVMLALRRYKRREMLRIAYGDIVRGQHVSVVARQLSYLADANCEAALRFALAKSSETRGRPRRRDGQPARMVVLALGKLGGEELNYSSDIDLMLLYDEDGRTDGPRSLGNQEYFDRVGRHLIRLLGEQTELGFAYRVDMRLRPEGSQGQLVVGLESALHYYDLSGRTWERQAFVKARPIAGDLELGREFLRQLEPWIYRRYLSRADISGIKALKRRIEHRAEREGGDVRNVKTGRGGIRDIEFVIQFLQLLNGGELPAVRTGNTLEAIDRLEQAGCLTMQERSLLTENYARLRKIEHRLQIMFDLQTHTLPDHDVELAKLAVRMGHPAADRDAARAAFRANFSQLTAENRKILDHLLHDAFPDEAEVHAEVDLVLDPLPSEAHIAEVLGRYGFSDVRSAHQNLTALGTERVPFLSTRRCRHFLASIAPRLLAAIAATPDPDSTLVQLVKVSDSLGGKGVLWELFSFSPPSLRLYVELCALAPYLAGILTSSPGMIDELMDSLMLDKLPTLESLDATLSELCRRAEDLDPILHSFKNSEHLRVGVRDILGKEDIRRTHRALSDVAEVCLKQIALHEFERLAEKYGRPTIVGGPRDGEPCELLILALGKLGGREPNYHSDLDVVFLYEAEGATRHRRPERTTTNQHFFSHLGQRITKVVSQLGPYGRLYELDPRLRPTGRSGPLAVSVGEFARYFSGGQGQLWERQALCKARPLFGSPEARRDLMEAVRAAITARPWTPAAAAEIRRMRQRLEETASPHNLKRGRGGTVDIEFAVQMLQLRHAHAAPRVLVPGTLEAIEALHGAGFLEEEDLHGLSAGYRFLRSIEARLRLMNTTARHDLPHDELDLKKLALLLNYESPRALQDAVARWREENRRRFERLFDEASAAAPSARALA